MLMTSSPILPNTGKRNDHYCSRSIHHAALGSYCTRGFDLPCDFLGNHRLLLLLRLLRVFKYRGRERRRVQKIFARNLHKPSMETELCVLCVMIFLKILFIAITSKAGTNLTWRQWQALRARDTRTSRQTGSRRQSEAMQKIQYSASGHRICTELNGENKIIQISCCAKHRNSSRLCLSMLLRPLGTLPRLAGQSLLVPEAGTASTRQHCKRGALQCIL